MFPITTLYSIADLSGAGDVNNDGYDDILISTLRNKDGGSVSGKTYLIFGKDKGWTGNMSLSDADASFIGEKEDIASGTSLSSAGDVNNDGYDDFLIGAPGYLWNTSFGKTYLILGKGSGWKQNENLSTADATFTGEQEADYCGTSVSGAGDVNGDGYDDFLIGAPEYEDKLFHREIGHAYLFFGKRTGWGNQPISSADASFLGNSEIQNCGEFVSDAGDVNGDGFDDFLINGGWDHTFVIFGKAEGWKMNTEISSINTSFIGDSGTNKLSRAGDVNNDGYDDFLIGINVPFLYSDTIGKVYLILGKEKNWTKENSLNNADMTFSGESQKEAFGMSFSGGGDFNGDGYDDIIIGAPGNAHSYEKGITYIYFIKMKTIPQTEVLQENDSTSSLYVPILIGAMITISVILLIIFFSIKRKNDHKESQNNYTSNEYPFQNAHYDYGDSTIEKNQQVVEAIEL